MNDDDGFFFPDSDNTRESVTSSDSNISGKKPCPSKLLCWGKDSMLSSLGSNHEQDGGEEEEDANSEDEFAVLKKFPGKGPNDEVHVELVELCCHLGAPLYAFDHIMKWAQESYLKGYHFPTNAPHYNTFISDLTRRLEIKDFACMEASVTMLGGGVLSFPKFDFKTMFISLLDNACLWDHLLINWEDPSKPPPFNPMELDEIHSGSWHALTSSDVCKCLNDVLCGIIVFIDRTHVAEKEKLTLCPLMFTLSIIPRYLRNQPFAWRPLGFIPKLPTQSFPGQNYANTHHVFESLLSGLANLQSEGGICCSIPNELGLSIHLWFKVPLCLSIGDVEGQDVQVGRYANHNTKLLNQECNVTIENADNGDIVCKYTFAKDIQALCEKKDLAALSKIGYHTYSNAFDKLILEQVIHTG